MKKLLFIITTLLLFSCSPVETITKDNLPIEIVTLKETNSYDTICKIESNDKVYLFTKKEEYIGAINKASDDEKVVLFLVVIIMTLFAVGIALNRD